MLFIDSDPVTCASTTPVSMYHYIIKGLSEAISFANSNELKYKKITSSSDLKDLLVNDIAYSKRNRDWLVTYFNTLAMNNNKLTGCKQPPMYCEYSPKQNVGEYYSNPLNIHSPLYDKRYLPLVIEHQEEYKDFDNVIDISRLVLLQLEPSEDEFQFGEPIWLHSLENRDFTAFDPINKLHVRIVRTPKKYRYFTSHISDNWKEVCNVPVEIDKIIDCILLNRS